MNDSSDRLDQRIAAILDRYPTPETSLLPMLWAYQQDRGWLPPEVLSEVAARLGLSPALVESTASFYTMLYLERPAEYVIQLCDSLSCHLCSSRRLFEHLKQRLGIEPGESTGDGRFALATVHCLGGCDNAPVVRINDESHARQTPETLDRVLDALP